MSARPGAQFCRNCRHPLTGSQKPTPPAHQAGRFGTGDLLPTTLLADRYIILEKIAQGGMGAVYRAQDKRLHKKVVAVKEMSERAIAQSDRESVVEAFQREAELLARLNHPNLARVTDRFQKDDRHFMVMEYIEGETLGDMLERRSEPFSEKQVLSWAGQLCDVLRYLHSQEPKVIYRDLKPGNVMVVRGTSVVKLIDFGIARFYKPGKRRDTIVFGTEGYAPPEQYGKAQTDERADVYALGALLHQLLTLRDPATDPFDFPNLRSLNSDVSRRVDKAVTDALLPNKRKRHQCMAEMQAALLGDRVLKAYPTPDQQDEQPAKATRPTTGVPSAPGKLVLTPSVLNFGSVSANDGFIDRSLAVSFPDGDTVTLSTDVPWLHVHPQEVDQRGSQVTVNLDTDRLTPGRLHLTGSWFKGWAGWHTRHVVPAERHFRTHVEVELENGHKQRVPVSAGAAPRSWQVYAGWTATALAMLVELIVLLAIVMAVVLLVSW